MKILNGRELAGFIKERQAHQIASMTTKPKLLIIRDSNNPVITKYVNLKKRYGEDIGVEVIDTCINPTPDDPQAQHNIDELTNSIAPNNNNALREEIIRANSDPSIDGIIIQLPLTDSTMTDELCDLIAPSKDVDGLGKHAKFDSATATAILWLLAGYDIKLENTRIALVGRGKLVGAPLYRMFIDSGYTVELFHRGSDLTKLRDYDVIITATGHPGLITSSMIAPATCLVDAGTASEDGVLKGDLDPALYTRTDLSAITPTTGGVGPLTVTCLFDHVINSHLNCHA